MKKKNLFSKKIRGKLRKSYKILFTFQIFLQKVWSFTIFAYICTIKPICKCNLSIN